MKVTVPSAEALKTALGTSARESLVALATAIAEEIQATDEQQARYQAVKLYLQIVRDINNMDRLAVRQQLAEARTNWILAADPNGAAPSPRSSLIDELRAKREHNDQVDSRHRDGEKRAA